MKPLVMQRAIATAARRVIAEPAGLVVAAVFYLMVTSVLSGLWHSAANANGGAIVGYSATALVWYIATSEACVIALPQRLIEDIGTDIGSGRIELELLRPVSALGVRIATEIGRVLPRVVVCMVAGVSFAVLIGGAPPDTVGLAIAVPAVLLAVSLNLVMQHVFASAAFWVLDAKGAWFLYQKLVFVLGGMLLPLEVLPASLETVAKVLPFSAMAYIPARLASGHVEPELLLIQVAWLAVTAVAAAKVFSAGERRVLGAVV